MKTILIGERITTDQQTWADTLPFLKKPSET